MERSFKFIILALSHFYFLTATGTQYVSEWHEGEPSQRAGLDVFQHSQQQLKPGAPPLLPLFPTAPDLPPRVRESPQPTLISPEVQIPVLAGNIAAMPRSERPQWDWNSPLPQFAPFTGASTANGKEGESSMQAAMVGPTRYHPLTRAGAATAGNAGQPIHFVLSDRNTREVEFQQPASKRYQLDLTSEPPEFPASGQRITRLPGSALPQFRPSYLTDGNNGPESYQLGAASFAGHVLPSHLPFYSYHGNMPQFNQVETVGLPGLAHPPHPLFYSSGIERPSPSQLGTQALPGSALPAESSVCSNDFQSTRCNSLQRERALKAVAPLVGPPPPKYGSASSVGNANAIEAGSLSCNIDYMEKNLRKSENKRSTVLYAVEDNDATSNLRKSPHQGTESLGCFTSRAWAWLMSIWIRNKDAAISETNKHFGQSFQKLTSACLTRHDSLHEASSSASAPLGPSEPIKFAYLLWAINKRALEVLKGKQRVPTYLDEQKDFMKWFIDFMTNCKDLGHCSDLEGDFLHEKIMTALDSKDVNSGFEVILPEIPPTHHVLANKDALMNEAAARAVMRYHKEKNFPLFNLYGNIGFVQKLAAFGSRWCYRYVPQPGRRIPRPNQGFHKTRWEKYVEKYVKPINFSAGKAAEQPTEPFALEDQGPKVWAWLSGLKSRTEQPVEETTTSNNILQDYIKQIQQEYQKEATYGPEEWGKRFYDLMWHINGSILETMRFSGSPNDFLQQQALTRFFFDQVLSRKKSKILEAEALRENSKMDKYDELLKKLVFIEGKKPIFKIKHNKNTRGYSFVSEDDIILTEIAVNIIGSYYQTKNIEKWITLFGNSTNFIQFLMKLRHKQTGTMTLELAQATFYFLIPKIELFPWEMKTKIFNGEITNQAQRVFQHHSKIQLDSWIEDVQDKSTTE